MSLQTIIQQIKTATLPGENTALRVGSALEQMDSALEQMDSDKRNISDSLSTSETIDMVNAVKIIAATGTPFLGTIDPTTVIPAGNFWAFAGEGTYANAGGIVVGAGDIAIITRVGATFDAVILDVPVKSINTISKTGTAGLVDTYSITYTDGSTPTTFEVANGETVEVSPEFDPNTTTEAQGGKQINDYFLGEAKDVTNIITNTYIKGAWGNIASAGNNMVKLDVSEGDILEISGLDSTNTAFNAVLRKVNHSLPEQRTFLINIPKPFKMVIPHGFDGFVFVSNGNTNWKVIKKKTGKLKIPEYSIGLKSIVWGNGNWGENGEAVLQKGVRKTPIMDSPSKIKITDFPDITINLKFYNAQNKYIGYIDAINGVEYDLTGFPKYTIVVVGAEGSANLFEIKEKTTSGSSSNANGTETVNIFDYNGVGSGLNDDTPQFNLAVQQLITRGGGKIILPNNGHFAVSNVEIPPLADDWIPIEFDGLVNQALRFGTAGGYPNFNNKRGATLESFASNPEKGIIDVKPYNGGFSAVHLVVKNLNLRAQPNPTTSGINGGNAYSMEVQNVDVNTSVYNVQAVFPDAITKGIITPKLNNAAFTRLKDVSVSGFRIGIGVNEHTHGDNLMISSCVNGLFFNTAAHASYFSRVCSQRNQIHVRVDGSCLYEIAQLNMEYVGNGQFTPETAWQKTLYELQDDNNLGKGKITYANVRGMVGAVGTFRISGAANTIVKKIGSDTRLTGSGIPDPNPII